MSPQENAHHLRAVTLAAASDLFETGALADAATDESFVKRLNALVPGPIKDRHKGVPATLAEAIKADGALKQHSDLFVFGKWLLIDGQPGMKIRPGKQPDPRTVLKCVATVMAEIKLNSTKKKFDQPESGRSNRKKEITKHAVAQRWKRLFGENVEASSFDATLRSLERILPVYLQYLKSGAATHAGKKIKKSPEIERVLDAITGRLPKARTDRPGILTEPDVTRPARLVPFDIPLGYQSDGHEEEYRQLPKGIHPVSRLRYLPKNTTATASSGNMRSDRAGKITLEPEVEIRRDYKVVALIDRLAILVQVSKSANAGALTELIKKETKATCYVEDILHKQNLGNGWGAPLSNFDPMNLAGYPLAIMIQEPTSILFADILKTIDAAHGIVGPVQLHLIEVSVDFYPKDPATPEEAILRRERMVGLLQRHHWTRPSHILEPGSAMPRYADARQIHDDEDKLPKRKPKTRRLFAHVSSPGQKTKHKSDSMIAEEGIRDRVLTENEGYVLFLNSTVLKGDRFTSHLVSIQNKITDKRHPIKEIYVTLRDEERRARMEVTISGTETLKNYGLHTIDDLGSISFRKLTRDFLRCRLPMIEPVQHIFEDAQTQMRNRGVYGINLRLRALAEERRVALKQAGKKMPRKTKEEELGLADWTEMNDVIGAALDGLQRRWSSFNSQ